MGGEKTSCKNQMVLKEVQIKSSNKRQVYFHNGLASNLETSILGQAKTISHSSYCMSSISVTGNILVGALNSNLQPCATIRKHLPQMRSKTVIWPPDRLKKDKNILNNMCQWKEIPLTCKMTWSSITMIHGH